IVPFLLVHSVAATSKALSRPDTVWTLRQQCPDQSFHDCNTDDASSQADLPNGGKVDRPFRPSQRPISRPTLPALDRPCNPPPRPSPRSTATPAEQSPGSSP